MRKVETSATAPPRIHLVERDMPLISRFGADRSTGFYLP
jgi:hypothetical protein